MFDYFIRIYQLIEEFLLRVYVKALHFFFKIKVTVFEKFSEFLEFEKILLYLLILLGLFLSP